jgi:molybdate-binding protein
MKNSSLEINEEGYHLLLRKEDFDLSFITQLVKSIQARELFFNFSEYPEYEDDINNRADDSFTRFDSLSDK